MADNHALAPAPKRPRLEAALVEATAAVQEARGPFLLIAVCAGVFLGLQPDSWFPKRAVALPLLGRRQVCRRPPYADPPPSA